MDLWAIKEYIKDHPIDCAGVNVLVAFSGTVKFDDDEKEYTEAILNMDSDGNAINTDKKFRKAFRSDKYNIMVVADKYQTGFDEGSEIPKLYMTDPSGQVTMWKSAAIGKNADKVIGLLENGYKENMTQNECLVLAIESMLQYVEAGSKNMEIAVMTPGQLMQVLPDEKVDELIKGIEEKKKNEEKK